MEFIETGIEGVWEIVPRVFGDKRGYFLETFKQSEFEEYIPNVSFVQDNQSFSTAGVLRGLHFQKGEHAQGKLVRVLSGKVLDVAVDLRDGSPTFGQHVKVVLDAERHNMLYVPEGFAHGFYTIEDATFSYKCTNYYNKESEGGLLWNDADLAIDWGAENPLVSEKDEQLGSLADFRAGKVEV